jgi:nitrite reductase (cytochrome c-552)
VVTFPWHEGLSAEDMERYYDNIEFADFTHKISKTPIVKAQHPGYEIASTGIHAQKGVSCADCHMPYTQEGAVKYSDHQVRNPLETMDRSCMTCHRESEEKLKSIVHRKFERKEYLMEISMDNLAKAHLETGHAMELGATDEELKEIRTLLRHGQWRWDYSIASHGSFFHAPEETLRLLASANEKAQQARIKLVRILAKHGDAQYIAPDFDTKEKAQALAGVNLQAEIDAKMKFKQTLEQEWYKAAKAKGLLDEENRKDIDLESSYFKK